MKVTVHKCRNIIHPFPIFAWLIIIVQGMNPFKKDSWSHMALEFDGKFFDVTSEGCKESTKIKFLKSYRIVESHTMMDLELTNVDFYSFFNIYRGRHYDDLQIAGLLLKGLGLISFNTLGHDLKQMICNELPLAFVKHYYKFTYRDSDNYNLLNTWELVKRY